MTNTMESVAKRIVRLSRLVGAAPWETVPTFIVLSGIYQRVYDQAGISYPPVDWVRVQQVHAMHLR
jgi:hypothetical protein